MSFISLTGMRMGILLGLTGREWELYPRHHGNGNELLGMGGNGNVENHSRTSLAVSTGVIYGHPYTYGPLSRVVCKRAARIEQSYDKTASTYSRMPVQLDRLHQSPAEPFSPQPWLRPSPPVIRPSLPDSTTAQRPRSDCMMIITVCLSVIHARCQLVVDSIERERRIERGDSTKTGRLHVVASTRRCCYGASSGARWPLVPGSPAAAAAAAAAALSITRSFVAGARCRAGDGLWA